MFSIDEVGIARHEKDKERTFTRIFPYPRECMSGDAVYDELNAAHPIRRFVGACMGMMGV
jgi:hypothetical protein